MKSSRAAAVGDVAAEPVCASVFVNGEEAGYKYDLDDEVNVHASVSGVGHCWGLVVSVLATQNTEHLHRDEQCASEIGARGSQSDHILSEGIRLIPVRGCPNRLSDYIAYEVEYKQENMKSSSNSEGRFLDEQ